MEASRENASQVSLVLQSQPILILIPFYLLERYLHSTPPLSSLRAGTYYQAASLLPPVTSLTTSGEASTALQIQPKAWMRHSRLVRNGPSLHSGASYTQVSELWTCLRLPHLRGSAPSALFPGRPFSSQASNYLKD